ncbi:MAG: UDP-glucose 4-epimerase GalE, partial [Casimicrobiaceae bacterium]
MQQVLVVGGAGYIGSHTCKALAAAGYMPVTFDNLVSGHRWAVRWGPFVQGDVLDRAALDAVFERFRPVAVMHFAAHIDVGESVRDPGRYYRNNVAGSLELLRAAVAHGVAHVVLSSTAAVYGVPERSPLDESHPIAPINPYGASKFMVERMLGDFDAAHGLRSISLRYFNAAGADPEGETGEAHDPETHLIPLVLDAAAGLRPHIVVHGDDHPTPDGTCIRDYIHVSDLAQAHVLALRALEAGAATTAYNLGNGRGFSVREVIEVAREVTGRDISVVIGPRRAGDPPV